MHSKKCSFFLFFHFTIRAERPRERCQIAVTAGRRLPRLFAESPVCAGIGVASGRGVEPVVELVVPGQVGQGLKAALA